MLGGVERSNDCMIFIIEVTGSTASTLLTVLLTHVRSGTKIINDGIWIVCQTPLAFDCYNSAEMLDSIRRARAKTIGSPRNGVKTRIGPRTRTSRNI
ncbi:LOW QUALITY PROTEIN: hypothetical protein HZS_1275 [Henneguya salminicola]|nr:LOW QUALITY PROTEIN: hypothetical protein HZS_1275 [Henneguya salminicola]